MRWKSKTSMQGMDDEATGQGRIFMRRVGKTTTKGLHTGRNENNNNDGTGNCALIIRRWWHRRHFLIQSWQYRLGSWVKETQQIWLDTPRSSLLYLTGVISSSSWALPPRHFPSATVPMTTWRTQWRRNSS